MGLPLQNGLRAATGGSKLLRSLEYGRPHITCEMLPELTWLWSTDPDPVALVRRLEGEVVEREVPKAPAD